MKLLPSRRRFWVHHTTMHHFTVSLYSEPHRWVYVCLSVTCHLHFWQNDRDLLRANAVTRGWNGYRNQSQHRKLIPEKKILPLLLSGLQPATFRSRVWRCTTELPPLLRPWSAVCLLASREQRNVKVISQLTNHSKTNSNVHGTPLLQLIPTKETMIICNGAAHVTRDSSCARSCACVRACVRA